jgi:tetratricopeptide (TPR) repeat protein
LNSRVVIFKCNVDYTKRKVTWAFHESYLHRGRAATLPRQLIPHLVSRIYCFAGGLNPTCPGIEFTLSPRVHSFVSAVSSSTTGSRGIFNTRDETLASQGYRRMHVICCDALCSHTALWLRVATTGLVLAMTEAGLAPGAEVQLRHPVQALHSFATDPHFRTTAELASGNRMTALELQRHYLEQAEAHLDHDCMPPWAEEACLRWRAMLDRLACGPGAVGQTLDWAIKHSIFTDHLRCRGIEPETLPHWNKVLTELQVALRRAEVRRRLNADVILEKRGPLRNDVRRLEPILKANDLHWDQVRDVLRLRAELCEIDMLMGQIAPDGIFRQLEPHLDHRIIDEASIDEAMSTPPQTTRAKLRGEAVRDNAGRKDCSAGWTFVRKGKSLQLVISDPLKLVAKWERVPDPPEGLDLGVIRDAVSRDYNRGDLGRAYATLEMAFGMRSEFGRRALNRLLPYLAWVESRRGRLTEAIAALDELADAPGEANGLPAEYLAVHRFQGLTPARREVWTWIERSDQLRGREVWGRDIIATYLGHKGYVLARTGSLEQAQGVLRSACAARILASAHPRVAARSMADLADVLRIRGERDEAATWLDRAQRIYDSHEYNGEEADYLLTYRAKLAGDTRVARVLLRKAKAVQARCANYIGVTRTLLLEARLSPTPRTIERRKREVIEHRNQIPDLRSCPLLAKILDRWSDWAGGCRRAEPVTENGDYFWLL